MILRVGDVGVGVVVLAMLGACDKLPGASGKDEAKSEAKSTDDESEEEGADEKKKGKKKKKKGKAAKDDAGGDEGDAKSASAPPAAVAPPPATNATVAPPPPVAPTSPPPSVGGIATLLSGEPEPGVAFLRQQSVKGHPIVIRLPPNWKTSRDETDIDYVDNEVSLNDKFNHAQAWLAVVPKLDVMAPDKIKFNVQRIGASNAAFQEPVAGTFGAGIPAKIADGTCDKFNKPAKCWYVIADYDAKQSLIAFASLKEDVYPKLRGELLSVLRSTKINR